MTNEIDVLIVEPGKSPRPARVEDTQEAFQEIVGGPIDAGCYLPQRVMLISNSEGKNMGLMPNRENPTDNQDFIAGTFLLCSFEENNFTSLSPAQQQEFEAYFALPDWEGSDKEDAGICFPECVRRC